VGRWESSQEPSSYYWGRLAELAREHAEELVRKPDEPTFATLFLRAQLDRTRVSAGAWETAMAALVEWNQVLVAYDELTHDRRERMQEQLLLLIESLDSDGTATSAPDAESVKTANQALWEIVRIRTEAVRERHAHDPEQVYESKPPASRKKRKSSHTKRLH